MKLSVLLVIARLPLDFFQGEVELIGNEKQYLLHQRYSFI